MKWFLLIVPLAVSYYTFTYGQWALKKGTGGEPLEFLCWLPLPWPWRYMPFISGEVFKSYLKDLFFGWGAQESGQLGYKTVTI